MARPKKDVPRHSSGMYEFKTIIGHNFDGSPIRKSFYSSKSKADAKQKSIEYKIKQGIADATGEIFVEKNVTFESYAEKFLESTRGTVRDNTYNNSYKSIMDKHIIPYFGKSYISNITKTDIQVYINKKAESYSYEFIHKHKNCLHRLFENAIDDNLCKKNPVVNIKMPANKPTVTMSVYNQEQADKVKEYAKTHRYGLDILLLLEYGLSRSELLGLQWSDFDYDNLTLFINRGVTDTKNSATHKMEVVIGEPKNDFRKRVIAISQETAEILNAQPRYKIVGENKHKGLEGTKVETEFIITNKNGEVCSPRTWSRRHFDTFMTEMQAYYKTKEIDMPVLHPHELRHTRASLWVNDGVNLFAIAAEMGHADLKMLRKRYGHPDVESMRKLLNIK